jgi:hypothetical protein
MCVAILDYIALRFALAVLLRLSDRHATSQKNVTCNIRG